MSVHQLYGEKATGSPLSHQSQSASPWSNQSQSDGSAASGWFHGVISRKDAETLLMCKPAGCFLIRVGESRNGFTLSYRGNKRKLALSLAMYTEHLFSSPKQRAADHCRHFMIDLLRDGNYTITGESTRHRSLQDLVDFHSRTPIMPFTELLTVPCTKVSEDTEKDADVPPDLRYRTSLPSTPPCHTDHTPDGGHSQTPGQVSQYDSRLQPSVNCVQPTSLTGLTDMYNIVQAGPAAEPPLELPRPLETHSNGWLYPTLSSAPSASSVPASEHGPPQPQEKRAEPKALVVPSQVKLMGLFRKKKAVSQEGALTEEDGLPEEYLQPPPFAPGYC